MDAQTIAKKAGNIKRTMIYLTAYANDPSVIERLTSLLEDANLESILIQTCPDFHEWMETLPTEPIPELGNTCRDWIRHWGSGGGDCSTEDQIKAAIDELDPEDSDVPRELADAMYCNIAEYSKTPFEASQLVMELIIGSLADCEAEKEK